ncbi:hypothetical protein [Streptomyces sp. NPDC050145]|uniref:hypothetical protein n=1 Tax=Streptomyces sp. NPDC050145 TaxID=3365602 RepID=UPI0037B43AC1
MIICWSALSSMGSPSWTRYGRVGGDVGAGDGVQHSQPPGGPGQQIEQLYRCRPEGRLACLAVGALLRAAVPGDVAVEDRCGAAQYGQLRHGARLAGQSALEDVVENLERVLALGHLPRLLPHGVGDGAAVAEGSQGLLDALLAAVVRQCHGRQPIADPLPVGFTHPEFLLDQPVHRVRVRPGEHRVLMDRGRPQPVCRNAEQIVHGLRAHGAGQHPVDVWGDQALTVGVPVDPLHALRVLSPLPEQQLAALLAAYVPRGQDEQVSREPEALQEQAVEGAEAEEASQEDWARFYEQVAQAYVAEFGSSPDAVAFSEYLRERHGLDAPETGLLPAEVDAPPPAETPDTDVTVAPAPQTQKPVGEQSAPSPHPAPVPSQQRRSTVDVPLQTEAHNTTTATEPQPLTVPDQYFLAYIHYVNTHGREPKGSAAFEELSQNLANDGVFGTRGQPVSPSTLRRYALEQRIYRRWAEERGCVWSRDMFDGSSSGAT